MKNNVNLNVAVIGVGNICLTVHAPLLKRLGVNVIYAVDTNNDALAKIKKIFPNIKLTNKINDLNNKTINSAIISSPTTLHYKHAKYLLCNHIHLLCEKPLATTERDAQELVNLSKVNNAILQVGYYRRFQSATQYIKKVLSTSVLGKLHSCVILAGHIFSKADTTPSLLDKKLSGGGCMMDFGPHAIDLLKFWFNQVTLKEYYDDNMGGIEANALARITAGIDSQEIPITLMLSRTCNIGYVIFLKFKNLTVAYHFNIGNTVKFISPSQKVLGEKHFLQKEVLLETENDFMTYFQGQWQEFTDRIAGAPEKISNLKDAVFTSSFIETCYKNRKSLILSSENIINHFNL